MVRILQFPAHVSYSFTVGTESLRMRELCTEGVTLRAATEAALNVLRLFGVESVEICKVDGTVFRTRLPRN